MPLSAQGNNDDAASSCAPWPKPTPCAASTRRQCKWCLRHNDFPNPVIAARASKPYLPWRRRAGRECAHCPWVLSAYKDYDTDKEELLAEFNNESKPARQTFLGRLEKWEVEKTTKPLGKFKDGDREKAPTGTKRNVVATSTASLQTKEFLGYFWPEKLWKKHNPGKKIGKRDVTWITHQGKPLKGTLLDESAGKPLGVIEVSNNGIVATTRQTELAASDSELDGDVDQVFESAQKRLCLAASPMIKSETGALRLSAAAKASAPECTAPGDERKS